jgi:predicted enzyme related to lactoylglutathione lyase
MPNVTSRGFLAALLVLSIAACTTLTANLPPVTEAPTGDRQPGKIIWRDLLTNDPAASQRFYGELFGWEFESAGSASNLSSDSAYTLIRHRGRLIGGMIDTLALNNRGDISQWVVVMSVVDIDGKVSDVRDRGGEIVTPPTDLQRRGRLAVVRDAEGALIALLETRDGDPADHNAGIGDFLWDELWTSDVEAAAGFYANIGSLGSDTVDIDNDGATAPNYRVLKSGDIPRVGVMPNPVDGLDPVWVSYIRVESPAAIAARVSALGGSVLIDAQPRPLGGQVAFIAGPSGAGIALQTWPLERESQEVNAGE